MTVVGTVVSIARYPVKSMQAEPLDAAELHWPWLHGDRQYAFVKGPDSSSFPWLTARDVPELLRYRARYVTPLDPAHSKVRVTDPDGAEYHIRDPALAARLAEACGVPVWLLRLGRGCFDAMPVSIVTTSTVEAVGQAHGEQIGIERFRANIVIRPTDPEASEPVWLGHQLAFGGGDAPACLEVDWLTPRCAMVGFDPATAVRDPRVVRTVVRRFGNRIGAYCSVRAAGTIRVGDAVRLIPAPGVAPPPGIPRPRGRTASGSSPA